MMHRFLHEIDKVEIRNFVRPDVTPPPTGGEKILIVILLIVFGFAFAFIRAGG